MSNRVLGGDQILTIAQADAARVYRDLSLYRIQLVLEEDGWHVDYELKAPTLKGGGPHYLIDAPRERSSRNATNNNGLCAGVLCSRAKAWSWWERAEDTAHSTYFFPRAGTITSG